MPVPILYLITELDVGGAEKALFELCRRLDRRRYAPEAACLAGRGPVADWLEEAGVPVHALLPEVPGEGVGLGDLATVLGRLRRFLDERSPAILHTVLFHANLAGRLAVATLPRRRRPVVVSAVRVAERRYRWHLLADHLTCRLVDCEVCVSAAVRDFTRRRARIPAGKLRVIPNGVDVEALEAVAPADRAALGCPPGSAAVCFVGRLDRQKGVGFLLRALASLRGSAGEWRLLVVGAGPERRRLEDLAGRLGIRGRVRFLGWRADALSIVAACDLFVMPSLWEGMPNAVLEAMALGKCVVASAVEGTTELIEAGRSGLLVPPGRVRRLADAITVALTNPDRRRRMGAAARRRAEQHFPIERTVADYQVLYDQLLADRIRGPSGAPG